MLFDNRSIATLVCLRLRARRVARKHKQSLLIQMTRRLSKPESLRSNNIKRLRCTQQGIGRQLHNRKAQAIAKLLSSY